MELGTDSAISVPAAARLQTLSLAPTLPPVRAYPGAPNVPRVPHAALEDLRGASAMRCCVGFFMGNSLSDPKDLLIPFVGTDLVKPSVIPNRFSRKPSLSAQRSTACSGRIPLRRAARNIGMTLVPGICRII